MSTKPLFYYTGEPCSYLREETQQQNFQRHNNAKRNNTFDDLCHFTIWADALQNKQIHSNRRRDKSQLQIDQHHNVEPDRIEAQFHDNRIQNRQSDKNNGDRFQNTSQNQQQNINCDKDYPPAGFHFGNQARQNLRNLQNS